MKKNDIDRLNSFLRGELAAVDAYNQAMDKTDMHVIARSTLEECKRSHELRATALKEQITRLGGIPVTSSGTWGTITKAAAGASTVVGDAAAVSMLEEGEDHGLRDYKRELSTLGPVIRTYIETQILPEQERTHAIMSNLQDRV